MPRKRTAPPTMPRQREQSAIWARLVSKPAKPCRLERAADNDLFHRRANCVRQFGEEASDTSLAGVDPTRPLDDLRDYNAITMGWMYRMTSLTAAIARCQLARLHDFNQNAVRNAEYLTRRLSEWT